MMNPVPEGNIASDQYRVYWQPGCSSCLRAKEFLRQHNILFESINVHEHEHAIDELAKLGARSIPVVTRGADYVFAQDIEVLAEFVGVKLDRNVLPMPELVTRIDLLLAAAQRYLLQLPQQVLDTCLPGRDRNYLDLGFHVFVIPLAFLDAVQGKELTYAHFEQEPPDDMTTTQDLVTYGEDVQNKIRDWWQDSEVNALPGTVLTYYGRHSTHSVLERTAWHTAQHVRQLMELLNQHGIEPNGPLGDKELAGLPLPDEVYDDEIGFDQG